MSRREVVVQVIAVGAVLASILGLASCGDDPVASDDSSGAAVAGDADAAAGYCVEQGGRVVTRQAVFGTNGPEDARVRLGDSHRFCNFEATQGEVATDFRTQIELDLDTLWSEQPTMAILAYLEATPPDMEGADRGTNPASVHCRQLGGTVQFGMEDDVSGGGWLKGPDDTTTAFDQADLCVFPDGSMIDSWGITYHSAGTLRGVDLAEVIRYQPDSYPPVFGPVVDAEFSAASD